MAASQDETTVLVIDDERLIRLTLSAKLKLVGYTAVCVASTQEAVQLLNDGQYKQFKAVITDIMMDDMDGFVFRDILRGMDPSMPIFFVTALDPEEGSGFLKRIMEDSYSFYLPKAVKAEMLIKRVQSIVNSRMVEKLVRENARKMTEALNLASHVQRGMLPPRLMLTETDFYTTLWQPKDAVSGDLIEVQPLQGGGHLYVLGDIQGHGTSAALSMMAVQSFLKQLPLSEDISQASPAHIANLMQHFFATTLGASSYMTALICVHRPKECIVDWISCGAPDLHVIDPYNAEPVDINPEKRGGLPIGLMADTNYSEDSVVRTRIPESALCVAFTDGLFDIYRDQAGYDQLPETLLMKLQRELISEARLNGSTIAAPYKFLMACEAYGYNVLADDVTELIFGAPLVKPGVLERIVPINADAVDSMAQEIEQWCVGQGLDGAAITKVQMVFEEKLMNLHDHGIDIRDRSWERACIRLRKAAGGVELTIWDFGTQEPSMAVAAGSLDVALELKNREFSGHGRGRLMVRKICNGIQRSRFGVLNETIYQIPAEENGGSNTGDNSK